MGHEADCSCHLEPNLRMSGAVFLFPCICSWHIDGDVTFPLYRCCILTVKRIGYNLNESHRRHVCNCWHFSNVPRMMWKYVNDMSAQKLHMPGAKVLY
jgi:hypothetical protein